MEDKRSLRADTGQIGEDLRLSHLQLHLSIEISFKMVERQALHDGHPEFSYSTAKIHRSF